MIVPHIACIILLIMARDELTIHWILGIIAFLIISFACIIFFGWLIMVVPVVLIDIVLIMKAFGGDITIR